MRRITLLSLALAFLTACSGVPLRSIPRLVTLQHELLKNDPAELMLAIQIDARMSPPPDAVPILRLSIRPREAGAFAPVERALPMAFVQFVVPHTGLRGLAAAPANRRWLLYSLTTEAQAELTRIQRNFEQIRGSGNRGGSLAVGIAQEGVAMRDPAFASTRWESWLQTSHRDGFFELWSGTVAELLRSAQTAAASDAR